MREIDGQPVVVEKVVPSTQHASDVSTDALREIVRREIVDIAEHVGRSAMNRRNFTKVSAALASLFALPSWAVASTPDLLGKAERIPGKITRVRIGLHPTSELRARNHLDRLAGKVPTFLDPPDDDNHKPNRDLILDEVAESSGRQPLRQHYGWSFCSRRLNLDPGC